MNAPVRHFRSAQSAWLLTWYEVVLCRRRN